MKIFFSTQGQSLDLWYQVHRRLQERGSKVEAAYFIAESQHFDGFLERNADFPASAAATLKEWEIMAAAQKAAPDPEILRNFEQKLGNPTLWGPLVGDRRIYLGRKATYRQDYRPRFSHERMLAILQTALAEFDRLFSELRPDVVVTLYPATFGDYLSYLFGKHYGAQTLDFRLTRVKNYVFGAETIFEPSRYLERRYKEFEAKGCREELLEEARGFIDDFKSGRPIYDGMVLTGGAPGAARSETARQSRIRKLPAVAAYWLKGYSSDNQIPNPVQVRLYRKVLNPTRQKWIKWRLAGRFARPDELHGLDYAFYPLHTEPELTLNVYAPPFMNQIETVRLISHGLPVSWKLLVKDHPATFGRRPLSYYEKLLEIPNVRIVPPNIPASTLIQHSRLVAVITGSVALEAMIHEKPLVILGNSPFDYLPESMARRVRDPYKLPDDIASLLNSYRFKEESLLNYIAAAIDVSAPINLVTELLGKAGRFETSRHAAGKDLSAHPHVAVLSDYLWRRIQEHRAQEHSRLSGNRS